MQVFNVALKIMKKNKVSVLVYIGIFLFIAIFISKVSGRDDGGYTDVSVKLCVIDQDGSIFSEALKDYLSTENQLVDLPNDVNKLRDGLFYRNVEYVLYIPEGFGEDLASGREPMLDNVKVPGSFEGLIMDRSVDQYVGTLQTYLAGDFTLEESVALTKENMAVDTEVDLLVPDGLGGDIPTFSYYFTYLCYVMTALGILLIGIVLMPFFHRDVRRRNLCGAMRFANVNGQLAAACIAMGMAAYLLLNVVGILIYHKEATFWDLYPYHLLNGLCVSLVSFGLGFCCGVLAKSSDALSGMCNTFSLGFAFLGGVFVPQEVMNQAVLKFSRFVPSYWYVRVNDLILGMKGQDGDYYLRIWQGMGIQMGFALAIFAVGLVITRSKMEKA